MLLVTHYFWCNAAQSWGSFHAYTQSCSFSYDCMFLGQKSTWLIVVCFASVMMCFTHLSMWKCDKRIHKNVAHKNAAHHTFYMLKNISCAQSISPNSPHVRTFHTPYDPRYMVVNHLGFSLIIFFECFMCNFTLKFFMKVLPSFSTDKNIFYSAIIHILIHIILPNIHVWYGTRYWHC